MCDSVAVREVDWKRSRTGKLSIGREEVRDKAQGLPNSLSNYLLDLYTGIPYPLCWDWVSATVACLSEVSAQRYFSTKCASYP